MIEDKIETYLNEREIQVNKEIYELVFLRIKSEIGSIESKVDDYRKTLKNGLKNSIQNVLQDTYDEYGNEVSGVVKSMASLLMNQNIDYQDVLRKVRWEK